MIRVATWRAPQRRNTVRVLTILVLALSVVGCGAPEGTTVAALAAPTATPTAIPTPTATATPTVLPTATATVAPTATPTRIATQRPTVAPTVAPRPTTPTAVATPLGTYTATWQNWQQGEDSTNKLRYSFDAAQNEYHVQVLADDQEWSFYAPEGQKYKDFTLEVEARRVSGDDSVGYGLVFRRQPRQGDKASERYIFYVTAQGRFSLFQITPENTCAHLATARRHRPSRGHQGRATRRTGSRSPPATIRSFLGSTAPLSIRSTTPRSPRPARSASSPRPPKGSLPRSSPLKICNSRPRRRRRDRTRNALL